MKTKRVRYTVEGSGSFPFDMLRYDHSWPESESADSFQLGLTRDSPEYFKRRCVTLLTDGPSAPNEARWKSFSWRVIAREIVP